MSGIFIAYFIVLALWLLFITLSWVEDSHLLSWLSNYTSGILMGLVIANIIVISR